MQQIFYNEGEQKFLEKHAGEPCFFYNIETGEYVCFNSKGERAGVIYRTIAKSDKKWAFTDYFIGDTFLFSSADEAKLFFVGWDLKDQEEEATQ